MILRPTRPTSTRPGRFRRVPYPLASRRYNPDGWLFATRKLFPRLRELGISQEQIDRLNHDNPRRFFGG